MRSILLSLAATSLVACGSSEKPVASAPCPAPPVASAAPTPSVVASAAPPEAPADPSVTRSVIGDAQCLRYAPGYPEYLGLHCVLATGPSGHPEYVYRSVWQPQLFLRVDTNDSTVADVERDVGLRSPRGRIHLLVDCIDDALAKEPKLSGTVIVSWEIGKDGTAEKVKVGDGTMKSKAVAACAAAWVSKLRHFPAPDAAKPPPKITFVANFRTSTVPTNEGK
jgi:hypothetical protein